MGSETKLGTYTIRKMYLIDVYIMFLDLVIRYRNE